MVSVVDLWLQLTQQVDCPQQQQQQWKSAATLSVFFHALFVVGV